MVVDMKKITIYEHECNRCEKPFCSRSKLPPRCGKCKSPYWNTARTRQSKKAA